MKKKQNTKGDTGGNRYWTPNKMLEAWRTFTTYNMAKVRFNYYWLPFIFLYLHILVRKDTDEFLCRRRHIQSLDFLCLAVAHILQIQYVVVMGEPEEMSHNPFQKFSQCYLLFQDRCKFFIKIFLLFYQSWNEVLFHLCKL
jgi:hypothetical protein